MKQLLVRILIAVAAFIGVLALIGSFLPRDFDVAAEIEIDASADEVFTQINDLKNWNEWSSWSEKITPDIAVKYGAETVGKGATQQWTDSRGSGKLWITSSKKPNSVEFMLEFGGFEDMENQFSIFEEAGKSKVVWTSSGEMPSGPFYGYFGFLFESGMEYEYQKNLERLRSVVHQSRKVPAENEDGEPEKAKNRANE